MTSLDEISIDDTAAPLDPVATFIERLNRTLAEVVASARGVTVVNQSLAVSPFLELKGLYAAHAYSVIGYKEVDGRKLITLRNPWGEGEPDGDGKDDGIFDIDVNDATNLFQAIDYAA